jgi:hypothetical protein
VSTSGSAASHHMLIGVYKRLARLNFSSVRCEDSIGGTKVLTVPLIFTAAMLTIIGLVLFNAARS